MVPWTTPFTIGFTSGEYLQTPAAPSGIHSRDIDAAIPQSTSLARVERIELPTPGFGDQCST